VVDLLNPEKTASDDLSKSTSKAFAELLFMGKRAESLQVTPLLNDPAPLSEPKSVDEKFNQVISAIFSTFLLKFQKRDLKFLLSQSFHLRADYVLQVQEIPQ